MDRYDWMTLALCALCVVGVLTASSGCLPAMWAAALAAGSIAVAIHVQEFMEWLRDRK